MTTDDPWGIVGHERAVGLGARRHVRLLVVQILQAVLEVAQKNVCRPKLVYRFAREKPPFASKRR